MNIPCQLLLKNQGPAFEYCLSRQTSLVFSSCVMNCKLSVDSSSNNALFRVRKETPRFAVEDLREESGVPLAMVPAISRCATLELLSFRIFSFSITLLAFLCSSCCSMPLSRIFFVLGEDFALTTTDDTIFARLLGDVAFGTISLVFFKPFLCEFVKLFFLPNGVVLP